MGGPRAFAVFSRVAPIQEGRELMRSLKGLVRTIAIVGALAVLLPLSAETLARPLNQFPDGQVVQGPDGSLFVVQDGLLYPITPIQATEEQLAGASYARPVTTGVYIKIGRAHV